ncbi:hypothetical protein MKW92_035157 [Papaver armeniacum]|nr:hypothetical protein MKW92_035157 [Papaver armeniacum]
MKCCRKPGHSHSISHSPKVFPFLLHRRERTTSEFVPFLLDLETRLGILLVRTHFCQSIPKARQLISGHGRYSEISFLLRTQNYGSSPESAHPSGLRLLKTKEGSRMLMRSDFLRDLHSTIKRLGSHFAEHNKTKSHLYNFTWRVLDLAEDMRIRNENTLRLQEFLLRCIFSFLDVIFKCSGC